MTQKCHGAPEMYQIHKVPPSLKFHKQKGWLRRKTVSVSGLLHVTQPTLQLSWADIYVGGLLNDAPVFVSVNLACTPIGNPNNTHCFTGWSLVVTSLSGVSRCFCPPSKVSHKWSVWIPPWNNTALFQVGPASSASHGNTHLTSVFVRMGVSER